MRRQCGCLPHRLLLMHLAPIVRWVQVPGISGWLFSGYQLKFTCVKIFADEYFVAMQQVKRVM
ncbi:hypothetical protein AGRO_2876 [Agrobacterium sp. ATCC 31749]|nr:hypothetical protein AGRO_2876 [Agrobacterium sp. ATCC 31749]